MLLNSENLLGNSGETTFSDYPQSELTFSGPAGSKKRGYMALFQQNNLPVKSWLDGCAGSTTSGCTLAAVSPPLSGDIVSSHYRKSLDLDHLVRCQTQQLQSGIELLRRKHSRELLSMVEQQATKRLKVKEMELEYVDKRNVELKELVRQMAAESHFWFNYAKATESEVLCLKAKLDQVLSDRIAVPAINAEEGYGDSGSDQFQAADNQFQAAHDAEEESSTENQIPRACRICKEKEVCVLLLPCRHLCVCKDCESGIENCPICNSPRNASIQVLVN